MELQQRVTDVFSADTTSVEDYLRQIQDMTIITAIQVGLGGVATGAGWAWPARKDGSRGSETGCGQHLQ